MDNSKQLPPHLYGEMYWAELDKTFFPVGMHPIYFAKDEKQNPDRIPEPLFLDKAPKFRGIIDEQTSHMMACATTSYHLITNEEAFEWGLEIMGIVFGNDGHASFNSFAWLHKRRYYCYIFLHYYKHLTIENTNTNHSWRAFVRITNSYDKSRALRYEVGFEMETMNGSKIPIGLLVPDYSLDYAINHLWRPETTHSRLIDAAQSKYKGIDILQEFKLMVIKLLEIPVVDDEILPLFCKLANVPMLDPNKPTDRETAYRIYKIEDNRKKWIRDCGQNAYAALCAFAEYAAEEHDHNPFLKDVAESQAKLGVFMADLLEASRAQDFSLDDFIGKKAREVKKQIKMIVNP